MGGGIAARRLEVHEESTFITSKIILFQADQQKRSRTVGPGSYIADSRSGVNGGIDYMSTIEDTTRGRRTRRESVNIEALYRQPFAALNGSTEAGHSFRPNTARPRLGLDTNDALRSSEPALPTSIPLALSPAGMSQ